VIKPTETRLTAHWYLKGRKVVGDKTSDRIDHLINHYLIRIYDDPDGWRVLYRDPADARLWELSYPQSKLHGGGPPELVHLSIDEARARYPAANT
jgi:hypothetical protein